MKLSEIKDEAALDVIADIIDPLSEFSLDNEFRFALSSGQNLKAAKIAIKNHKKAIVEILAILNGEKVEEFHFNLISLPVMVVNLFNEIGENEDLKMIFLSPDVTETSSTSVLANTEVENE